MSENKSATIQKSENGDLKFRRSVADFPQAFELAKSVVNDNRKRQKKNAMIQARLNDDQPFNDAKLRAANQGWRNNFSTGFLSTIINRARPNYKSIIDSARHVTSSKLDKPDDHSSKVTEVFRSGVTKIVRHWPLWHDFTNSIIGEVLGYGGCGCVWFDEWNWKPNFGRQDRFILSDGSGQTPDEIPYFIFRRSYFIHELADIIVSRDAAELAGFKVDNIVQAINDATPKNRLSSTDNETLRDYEDAIRESTMSASQTSGVKVIDVYHVFVTEHGSKKVSQWMVRQSDGLGLMSRLDQFDSMWACLSTFTLEANETFYGSKGLGRSLYNMAIKREQSFNLTLDNLYLSGLILLKATPKGKAEVAVSVQHPVALVSNQFEVVENKISPNTEAFMSLAKLMDQMAEIRSGIYMPAAQLAENPGERRTASEVNYIASIEQQLRDGISRRFYAHYQKLIANIQIRICNSDNLDSLFSLAEAVKDSGSTPKQFVRLLTDRIGDSEVAKFLVSLVLAGASRDEIEELRDCPPEEIAPEQLTAAGALDQIVAQYGMNPSVNSLELLKAHIAQKLGHEFADRIVVEDGMSTSTTEQTRQQLIELNSLLDGTEIPVSPRDDDLVHLQTIAAKIKPVIESVVSGAKSGVDIPTAIGLITRHAQFHIESAMSKGIEQAKLKPFIELLSGLASLQSAPTVDTSLQPKSLPQNTVPGLQPAQVDQSISTRDILRQELESGARPIPPSEGLPLSSGPIKL